MDASLYRIRPLQADDIDTALELMQQANPGYDAQSLVAHRHLLEMATAPAGTGPTEEALRAMAAEFASGASGVPMSADAAYELLRKGNAATRATANVLVTLVAEEKSSGTVVGLVNAGATGGWSHRAITQLPEPMVRQLRERVVEISDIAVASDHRRRGIGAELLNTLLNADNDRARQWRVAIWFWHEGTGMGGFHQRMAPQWPIDRPIAFLDSGRGYVPFRVMAGDLRACIAPMHPDTQLTIDPTGQAAIKGIFDQPWPGSVPGARSATKPSKSNRKRDKKARGRARS
ncbi:GNAT family N-acetyltransferase [Kitasatospora sp. NPDC002965]|uniref:GNAT family N-acetyltransferase n=1 Tax=Kitasatospora sp. NPDC002965 TaxID=3154775 RepID=UPI0033A94E2B